LAFILATAASGPGGLLVPSLVTGGFLGLTVAKFMDMDESVCSACAVIGMGSMFASVMHMPVTGVIIIFELTRADNLSLHIALANFIASNVVYRLPHGTHSFVHRSLAQDPTWAKLDQRDFIETDGQEIEADVALFKTTLSLWLTTDSERLRMTLDAWKEFLQQQKTVLTQKRRDRRLVTPKLEGRVMEDEPVRIKSFNSEGSDSIASMESGLDVKRRRELREMWESVSSMIPGLNWRLWKSFNMDQRVALAEAASVVACSTPLTPKSVWEPNPEPQKRIELPTVHEIDDGLLDWHSLAEGPHWAMDPCMQHRFFNGTRNILNEGGTGCPKKVLGVTVPHPLLCKPARTARTAQSALPDLESSARATACNLCRTPPQPSTPR